MWHFYEGDPLELLTAADGFEDVTRLALGPSEGQRQPVHVVPAGRWQAARTTGDYTLVGCTVGPGFEFEDFEMLRTSDARADQLRRHHTDLTVFLALD